MAKIIKLFVLVIPFMFSCTPKTKVIPKKDMVSMLAKIHIVEASIKASDATRDYFKKDTIDLYGKTIESFGYTKRQFDSSLAYYSKDPKVLDDIYDKVINKLSVLDAKLAEENSIKSDSLIKSDTLTNLWNQKQDWELPTDGIMNSIDFSIPTIGLGTYTISADICVFPNDQSVNGLIEAFFFIDEKTPKLNRLHSKSSLFIKDGKVHNYSVVLEQKNSLVTLIKGSLFKHSDIKKDFKKHATITNIKVYFKPSGKKLNQLKRRYDD